MKEAKAYEQDLASIRQIMERSVKFISLSGLSGILAGIYGLIGAGIAYYHIYYPSSPYGFTFTYVSEASTLRILIITASVVLLSSLATGYLLSLQKAKKTGANVWNKASRQLLISLLIPLVTGGLLIIIFLFRGYYGIVAPTSLIFYGLALIQASPYTLNEIRTLGFCEIILGLISALLPGYGLIFWTLGFGILHIVYGSVMYYRYDK